MREKLVFVVLCGMLGSLLAFGFCRRPRELAASKSPTQAGKVATKKVDGRKRPKPGKPVKKPLARILKVVGTSWELLAPGIIANAGLAPGKGSLYKKAKLQVKLAVVGNTRQIAAALARGGGDKQGADLAILSLPTFLAMYEQLQALRPRIFFVLGRSRGREGLAVRAGASLLKLPRRGQVPLSGQPGTPASLLGLFVLDQAGVTPERVRLVSPRLAASRTTKLVAFQRSTIPSTRKRSRLLLSTADATGLIPYVVIAPEAFIAGRLQELTTWARVTLAGAAKLVRDVPTAARKINKETGAPSVVGLLNLLGWIRFSDLADNARLAGVSGRGAVTLEVLFRRTWRLWRESGLLSTPGPQRAPISTAVVMNLARAHPGAVETVVAPPPARSDGSRSPAKKLFVRSYSKRHYRPNRFINDVGFLAGVFERSQLTLALALPTRKAKALQKTIIERFDLNPQRVVLGKRLHAWGRRPVAKVSVAQAQ